MNHQFVIVAFGVSCHLDACIESIRRQTRAPDRLRIATSTPNDHIFRTAERFGVQVMTNSVSGGGISVDWNFALGVSSGELVTLAHQDDLYEPTYSEEMASSMARHPDSLIGFCDFEEVSPEGNCWDSVNNKVKRMLTRRAFGRKEAIPLKREKRKLLSLGNPVCCPSVVFNRKNLGGFEFLPGLKSNLDWEAWLRLADSDGSFVYRPDVLLKKRNHALSATAALISSRDRFLEDRAMFQRFWPKSVAAALMLLYRLGYLGNEKASRLRNGLPRDEQLT